MIMYTTLFMMKIRKQVNLDFTFLKAWFKIEQFR